MLTVSQTRTVLAGTGVAPGLAKAEPRARAVLLAAAATIRRNGLHKVGLHASHPRWIPPQDRAVSIMGAINTALYGHPAKTNSWPADQHEYVRKYVAWRLAQAAVCQAAGVSEVDEFTNRPTTTIEEAARVLLAAANIVTAKVDA